MAPRDYEFEILELAEQNRLPSMVDDESIAPIAVFRELVDARLLTGDPVLCSSVIDGYEFLAISLAGRRRLAELREVRKSQTLRARTMRVASRVGWVILGGVGTLLLQWIAKLLDISL